NAVYLAGGPTAKGSLRVVRHYRGKQLLEEVDLYDLLLHGVNSDIKRLEAGDSIQVPPARSEVAIDGMVRRPARYELLRESLQEAFFPQQLCATLRLSACRLIKTARC